MAWALCCRGAVIWGSSLGTGRAGKSLTSDLPGFLRKVKKIGAGVRHRKVHAGVGEAALRDWCMGRRVLKTVLGAL